MADNDRNDNGRRPSRGRPDHRSTQRNDRPFRKAGPPGHRKDGDRDGAPGPRQRAGDGPRPKGDRPFRKDRFAEDRPARGDAPRPRPERRRDERPRDERPREDAPAAPPEPVEDRIAKVIARAGIASRRDAEAMIADGRITLNGEVLTSPAVNVTPEDRITVDGEPLPARERTRLWIFHKPRGLVTTARDPQGRPTVFESLPEDMPRVVAIGRLDINTEGVLLLTNDGGLARVIAHPDTGWLRRYKVRAHGEVTQEQLDTLSRGITVDGIDYGPVEARLDRIQGDNVWLTMGLREGKNREIKNILEHLGLNVNRLIRLSFGPFQLGDLEPGLVEEVRTKVLREQLGQTLAAEAGVDFESGVREPIAPFGSPKHAALDPQAREKRPSRAREERPSRAHDERPDRSRGAPEEQRRFSWEAGDRRSVWRADEDETGPRRPKAPRRGADPKAARAASGQRHHERVGAIQSGEGRKVVVERLVGGPTAEEPRSDRPEPRERARPPRGDDRPRRREAHGAQDRSQDRSQEGSQERSQGRSRERSQDRSEDRSQGRENRFSERPARPPRAGARPERYGSDRPREGRPGGSRPGGDRPGGGRPGGGRPGGGRPGGGGPGGGRPGGGRPGGGRPSGDRPGGGRPGGGRPGGPKGPGRKGPPRDRRS